MKKNKGFTLVEVMVTVSIMTILFSVAGVSIADLKNSLNQTKADACARQIYVSAQDAITMLHVSGNDALLNSQREFSYDPETYTGTNKLRYIYSTDENIDAFCYDGEWEGTYVIEYDAYYGHVYGVFYSTENLDKYLTTEDDEQYRNTTSDFFLDFADENKYNIAYYGGTTLDATINVPDEEEEDPFEEEDGPNDWLDLTGTGFYYWEIYDDGTWGTYCIYDFETNKTHCKNCLKDRIVIEDGYGVAVEKKTGRYLFMDRKGTFALLSYYRYDGWSSEGLADLETKDSYLWTFSKYWTDETEDSITGYFYTRLGFWVFDEYVAAPWNWGHPTTIFTNMRFAKNGTLVSRGEDVPSVFDYEINETLYIRSPRQLYDLSLYYPKFALKTGGKWIIQETNLDYEQYHWNECTTWGSVMPKQIPIGSGAFVSLEGHDSFMMNYDGTGHYISGIKISQHDFNYSGLFSKLHNSIFWIHGEPIESGTVKNLILKNYTQDNAFYKGAIVGVMEKDTHLINCYADTKLYGYKNRKATVE